MNRAGELWREVEDEVLLIMDDLIVEPGWCVFAFAIAREAGLTITSLRGVLKSLREKGDILHETGIFSENGGLIGSGHRPTLQGFTRIARIRAERDTSS